MRKNIQTLQNIVSRKGSSKILTFSIPHVFKALQMLSNEKFVSRSKFGKEIHLGEGAVKTLISHLKENRLVNSTRSGTYLTEEGTKLVNQIQKIIPVECKVRKSNLIHGRYNHAILLKKYSKSINRGLEQRDFAILYGSTGCITILFKKNRFVFPGDEKECFEKNDYTKNILLKNMVPEDGDVVIISSSDDPFVSEISAKNSALWTLATS